MRYFVYFAYDGTDYVGWQRQPNGTSVQQVMEKAFSLKLREPVLLTAAGRTDAGVHALNMAAHFDVGREPDAEAFVRAMNSMLPPTIAINEIRRVRDTAHARFDAVSRRYEYHIATRKSPFARGRACPIYYPLDIERMQQAARKLLGRQDFRSFSKVHTDVTNFYCDITTAEFRTTESELVFTIEANRFLRGMVRAIVGTLVDIGAGRKSVEDITAIIGAQSRQRAGQAMMPAGLYFAEARYNKDIFNIQI